MASLTLSPLSSSTLHSHKPQLFLFNLKPSYSYRKTPNKKKIRGGSCKAEFSHDAPLAFAIGACMLNSLVFPITGGQDNESDSVIDSTDTRLAAMGIISFIPYFNWLSWVFAWLDTGKRRYAVYSLVYLAPYLRSNLSLSPEESWLPIASIVLCIIHVQLETSIRNGDLQGFQLFNEASKHLTGKNDIQLKGHRRNSEEGKKKENKNLPSSEEQPRNEIRPQVDDPEHLNEDW